MTLERRSMAPAGLLVKPPCWGRPLILYGTGTVVVDPSPATAIATRKERLLFQRRFATKPPVAVCFPAAARSMVPLNRFFLFQREEVEWLQLCKCFIKSPLPPLCEIAGCRLILRIFFPSRSFFSLPPSGSVRRPPARNDVLGVRCFGNDRSSCRGLQPTLRGRRRASRTRRLLE